MEDPAIKALDQGRAKVPPGGVFLRLGYPINQIEVALSSRPYEPWDLLRRVLKVVVDRDDETSSRMPKPAHNRVMLAIVPHQLHRHDAAGVFLLYGVDRVPRIVRAAIVDEDDLELPTETLEGRTNSRRQRSERLAQPITGTTTDKSIIRHSRFDSRAGRNWVELSKRFFLEVSGFEYQEITPPRANALAGIPT